MPPDAAVAAPGLLRFLTAGSIDDGKSTLIGRLLHDAGALPQDQLAALTATETTHGIDFSLVTDGLRAEREQGITIDVAYRYFATASRRFIIADTPGHEQYTRNMASGASTASLAVLLMDVRKGVLPQTCRHMAIAWLLGIRSFAVAVNKMDLVEFREDVFRRIEQEFGQFASRLGPADFCCVPTCALDGDNVVGRSERTPWYRGPTLLEHLERVPLSPNHDRENLRFPVQCVLRPAGGARMFAGQIASGVLRPGDAVLALPSERSTLVKSIRVGDREISSAVPPLSVAVELEEEIDLGRGDMLVAPQNPPAVSARITATLVWLGRQPLRAGQPYLIKHTAHTVCASAVRVNAVIDPATFERRSADELDANEVGEVEIEAHQPLYTDPYTVNRATGAFIFLDPISDETLAAGMVVAAGQDDQVVSSITGATGRGLTVWFTGLSSAGKTTISQAVYEKLWAQGLKVECLDGDVVRQNLSKGLGFSKEDRDENIRRIGFVAGLLTRNGVIALVSAISPYREVREEMRRRIGNFLEVYVDAPLEVCEQRDVKGIYRRARTGELYHVTGIDDPYEPPVQPEVECQTDRETAAESAAKVLRAVERWFADNGSKNS